MLLFTHMNNANIKWLNLFTQKGKNNKFYPTEPKNLKNVVNIYKRSRIVIAFILNAQAEPILYRRKDCDCTDVLLSGEDVSTLHHCYVGADLILFSLTSVPALVDK